MECLIRGSCSSRGPARLTRHGWRMVLFEEEGESPRLPLHVRAAAGLQRAMVTFACGFYVLMKSMMWVLGQTSDPFPACPLEDDGWDRWSRHLQEQALTESMDVIALLEEQSARGEE